LQQQNLNKPSPVLLTPKPASLLFAAREATSRGTRFQNEGYLL
jgi:hypothetical protein